MGADRHSRLELGGLERELAAHPGEPAIVCLQAGEINTGAFDPFTDACRLAHDHGAWVHVDGAFGLWAATSLRYARLTRGMELADSWTGIGALPGAQVVVEPTINQGLVRFLADDGDHDRRTDEVIARVQAGGEAWFGGTTWKGTRGMRVSVINWQTSESDVGRAIAAVDRALAGP